MPTNTLFQKVGALELPPTVTASLDPGRDILLALCEAALNAELGARWTKAATGSPLAAGTPVGSTLKVGPERQAIRLKSSGWPLLAVYRDGPGQVEQDTLALLRLTQRWAVDWILGPMHPDQEHQLTDVLQAGSKVLALTLEHGRHPAYQAGASVLGPWTGGAGFSRLWLRQIEMGQARFADEEEPRYHALSLGLETVEREGWRDGAAAPYQGARYDFGIGGPAEQVYGLIGGVTP